MSPVPWDSTSGEEGEYLIPREPPLKMNNTPQNILPGRIPTTSTPLSPPTRVELNKIEDELRTLTGAETRMDDRYYSYDDEGCPARAKPIKNAVIYHPPARQFVRVQGPHVRVIALMPITASQLLKFRKMPCYKSMILSRKTTQMRIWLGTTFKQFIQN